MSREPIRITREDLYRLLWSKTMRRIAEELGTTYVELVRACAAMEVPRPAPGHWEWLRRGLAVEQVPLPEAQAGVALEFQLRPKGLLEDLPPEALQTREPVKAQASADTKETVAAPVGNKCPVTVTRDELYEKIWQVSLSRLAKEWGTSYDQLVSACEAMNVPRPPAGHWTRLSLRLPVEKLQLPDGRPGTPTEATLQPQLSRAERAAKIADERRTGKPSGSSGVEEVMGSGEQSENTLGLAPQAQKHTASVQPGHLQPIGIQLPPAGVPLHAIAQKHMDALQKATPGELGFLSLRAPDLFWCDMTLSLGPRFGSAIHVLLCELEHRGYVLEEGESAGLGIVRDGNRIEVRWSEGKIHLEREPTNVDKRRPSWTWNLKETKATGALEVEVNAPGLKGKRKWKEAEGRSLEEVIGVVVDKVEATFHRFGEQRNREAELARQREEAEKRRQEEAAREAERQAKLDEERRSRERVRLHETKLEQIAELRRQNLLVAAKLWIQSRGVAAYVAYCEATWRVTNGGKLTQAQADWLAWAKAEAARMGPFGKGYPLPEKDGRFDSSTIPVGGPYPEPTELEALGQVEPEQPPARPEVAYAEAPRQREQFPFWLLHRKH